MTANKWDQISIADAWCETLWQESRLARMMKAISLSRMLMSYEVFVARLLLSETVVWEWPKK